MAVTALATVLVLYQLFSNRTTRQLVRIPNHFLPVPQSAIPKTVSNIDVQIAFVVLAVIVLAQVLLIGIAELGRHNFVIPIASEVALCIGFAIATYEMLRGYQASVSCSGPPTHCLVTYPSIVPILMAGLVTGIVIGAAWRLSWRADDRARRLAMGSIAGESAVNPR